MDNVLRMAVADARAYEEGGADAVIVENFGDVPFTKSAVPSETIASMAVAGGAIRSAIDIPMGFNVLRNDADAGVALCVACGGDFLRVNVLASAMVTDQGLIEGDAFHVLRKRAALAPHVRILADVHVKHAAPLGEIPIEVAAKDTLERGLADALVVSGTGTGESTEIEDVRRVRASCPEVTILLGSGAEAASIHEYMEFADGAIVGTSVKKGGKLGAPVDAKRVEALRKAMG